MALKSTIKLSWVDKTRQVIRVEDNGALLFVPVDPNNIDYQRFKDQTIQDAPNTDLEETLRDVEKERDRRIDSGFVFNFKLYQSRATDRENIAGASILAFMAIVQGAKPGNLRWHGAPEDFTWIAEDNTLVPMDAQTVVAFAKVSADQKHHLIKQARKIKDRIIAGETVDFTKDSEWVN